MTFCPFCDRSCHPLGLASHRAACSRKAKLTTPKQGEYWIRRSDGAKVKILGVNDARERHGYTIAATVMYRKTRPDPDRRDVKLSNKSLETFQKQYQPDPHPFDR